MGYYETAQVCLNGHTITFSLETSPEIAAKFCAKCGATTISQCPKCRNKIRGHFHVEGVFGFYDYTPPNYCFSCGAQMPWTQIAIEAAKGLTDDADKLSPEEKERLKQALVELSKDTPQTELAATRVKKIAAKAGSAFVHSLNQILIPVATEAAKKVLGL